MDVILIFFSDDLDHLCAFIVFGQLLHKLELNSPVSSVLEINSILCVKHPHIVIEVDVLYNGEIDLCEDVLDMSFF